MHECTGAVVRNSVIISALPSLLSQPLSVTSKGRSMSSTIEACPLSPTQSFGRRTNPHKNDPPPQPLPTNAASVRYKLELITDTLSSGPYASLPAGRPRSTAYLRSLNKHCKKKQSTQKAGRLRNIETAIVRFCYKETLLTVISTA